MRADDTLATLERKVRHAAILGTLQARFTDFPLLSPEWKRNCDEEALLGVSMTGIMDGPELSGAELTHLREVARQTNAEVARKIGINQAAAITCVKPSGTVSQLVDCASGIHPRHSKFYIRRVRAARKDPLTQMMIDQGVPHEASAYEPDSEVVFSFPQRAPAGALTRHDLTALQHLGRWMHYQMYWCDHKPSVTISVDKHEWPAVGAWVWENFDWMSGIAVLPKSDHAYVQAPYEDCTEETYHAMVAQQPKIDWSRLADYESEDNTLGSQTLACTGNVCELVDLV